MSLKDRFREWLSDNLRYIILIFGILIAVVILYFIIHYASIALDPRNEVSASDSSVSVSSTSEEVTVTPTPEETQEEEDEEEEEDTTLTKDGNAEISSLMTTYYTALGEKDMETLETVVDTLSADEQEQITEESYIEAYQDIAAYTISGQEEGTYVVLVSYNCKYRDIETPAPGLSQMYVYTDMDGSLVIAAEIEDESVTQYMSDILNRSEVRALIVETQNAYEAARESDAELDALISSVTE